MTKLAIIAAAVGASAFGLSGCDSKAENQVERQAEAIDEYDEAKADLIETLDEGGPDEEAGEAQADRIREQGEETKDRLEDEADQMDSTPQ